MKTIIITGSRKGIGLGLVDHYLRAGWRVIGCSRGEGGIKADNYRHFMLDVSDETAVGKMVRTAADENAGIDALINNAGIAALNHILTTPSSSMQRILTTNVLGSMLCLREVGKAMVRFKKGGRIVNFSTVAVPLAVEGEAVYAASKAAIESLTRIAARELAPYGITVNALGPTPIATDLIKTVPKSKIEALIARQAIFRMASIEDICNVIDFYLSARSNFITGQTIYLGGVV